MNQRLTAELTVTALPSEEEEKVNAGKENVARLVSTPDISHAFAERKQEMKSVDEPVSSRCRVQLETRHS